MGALLEAELGVLQEINSSTCVEQELAIIDKLLELYDRRKHPLQFSRFV